MLDLAHYNRERPQKNIGHNRQRMPSPLEVLYRTHTTPSSGGAKRPQAPKTPTYLRSDDEDVHE